MLLRWFGQVDMNALQNGLTGGVLLCKGTEDGDGQMVTSTRST